ncbi:hypothetical protein [Lichenifustis flavocetrariae]|uniref:Uncharacterized protein n=1 Tax=Lichenifustis flavocetrariae TaxID=2949735 RepID=A0AA41YTK9_9HYPH|nr:hypothetical protein [Lichenifustis flavocetrariae]MCW6507080.1 hypothetical protein [Lichenifustis flavocetrariae]
MIAGIIHRWRIGRLQRQAEAVRRHYLKALKVETDHEERDRLSSEAMDEEGVITDEIDWLLGRRLKDQARRYHVPVPDFDTKEGGPYERSQHDGRWRLTRPELHRLRSAIRAERKESFEAWSRWVALVLPVVSLVISIIALLRK